MNNKINILMQKIDVKDDCSESKYDLVTIKDVDYINLDEKIYTIDETGEPDKLFGTLTNVKFQYVKKSNNKIIVKR